MARGVRIPLYAKHPLFSPNYLINRAFNIEEGDPPQRIKEKIEQGLDFLAEEKEAFVPYVGSLYSLNYPEIENVSSEFWKLHLQKTIQAVLAGLAQRGPTVVCFEDLHWMDPSTLELLRSLLSEIRNPILFIPTFRPGITLLSGHQINNLPFAYTEINLKDLSPSETLNMVESLLKTDDIPADLKRFIKDRVEGNPFYLEEALNSLIESAALVKKNGNWLVTRPITESEISTTIHGVIAARVDRLERDAKRILQEASVIGRSFYYEILKRVTELHDSIDKCINGLERLDLIKAKSMQPDLEYIFKHALTQEVVYHSLLKKERSQIHDRIGLVIEQLFQNKLSEFYETLAFHFKQGRSTEKAVDYLIKSGGKSQKRYAVEEAHQYYEEAYRILNKPDQTREEKKLFIDLLNKWVFAYYFRGDFKGLTEVLSAHADLAESEDDMTRVGLFYFGMGLMEWERVKFRAAYRYLHKSLEIGEKVGNRQIIGYACALLAFTYAELGLLGDEAVAFGKRAHEIARTLESDHFLYFKSLLGIAHIHLLRGESRQPAEISKMLLEYGQKYHNIRSLAVGHTCMGYSHYVAGSFQSAIGYFQRAAEIAVDPFYYHLPKAMTGLSYMLLGEFHNAEGPIKEVLSYSQNIGCDIFIGFARACLGTVFISWGDFGKGVSLIEEARQSALKSERKWLCVVAENILGNVYSHISARTGPASLSAMAKNAGFLMKNIPFAAKRAEDHFKKAIEVSKEIGAPGLLAQSYFNLGLLYKAKKRTENAKEYISSAIKLFEECEAEGFLKQSRDEMKSLEVSKTTSS